MRSIRMLLVGALGVLLGVSIPHPVGGQVMPRWAGPLPAVEGFYTRIGLGTGGRTARVDGVGGRLMWALVPPAEAATSDASWLARHTAVGLFGAYTPPQSLGVSTTQVGLAVDLTPYSAPLAGRVEPFVSLGAGVMRTTAVPGALPIRRAPRAIGVTPAGVVPVARALAPAGGVDNAAFLVVPSVGARVQLRPGVALQADVRNALTFAGGATRRHPAVGTGLRLTF